MLLSSRSLFLPKTICRCMSPPPLIQSIQVPSWFPSLQAPPLKESWSYTEFIREMNLNHLESVEIYSKDLHANVVTKEGTEATVQLIPSENVLSHLLEKEVDVQYIRDPPMTVSNLFELMIQCIGIGLFLRLLFVMSQGNKGPFGMNQDIGKLYDEETSISIGFKDVAGIDSAKEDLTEVVDFLKDGDKYIEMGARIPKGILLVGPPGTGKTLLAKAVAGEAGVPFFSCSASEFIELFVGMGASRIRELFKKAQNKAPCIIFIDEIDAIGKKRSNGSGMTSNDEREQTINQLLTEMDGFSSNSGVIVIAATNRPELLDDALIRPGRFDRQIYVDLPDCVGRKAILEVHLKNKKYSNLDLDSLAKLTIGFSGADLENLCNEVAIYAAKQNLEFITQEAFNLMFDKIILGPESKTKLISEQKKLLVAYHESGHALMGILLGDFDNVRKISIVPRGNSGGVTSFEPSEERVDQGLYTREYLENQLMVMLGGRIAEELKFGTMKITTGASQDFYQATELATDMVTEFGFNETIGPLNVRDNIIGDAISQDIASEVKYTIEQAYSNGMELIRENEHYLDILAKSLMEKENLEPSDLLQLLEGIQCAYKSREES